MTSPENLNPLPIENNADDGKHGMLPESGIDKDAIPDLSSNLGKAQQPDIIPALADQMGADNHQHGSISSPSVPDSPTIEAPEEQHQLEKGVTTSSNGRPALSVRREILLVWIVCSGQIFTQAGLSITVVPLNTIGRGLGVSESGALSWFVASYSLTVGTFILIAGRLGDMFGHKKIFVAGFLWFSLWSLIAGITAFAHSGVFFDICRALQGIGPAMMVPNSLAILGRIYPQGRRKEMVFAIYGATAPNGFILGALFGSLLAKFVWWPWAFWIMSIACVVFGILSALIVPTDPQEDNADKRFDYLGALSGVAGLVLFNVAWNQAPIVGWGNPYVIVLLILGILILALFVIIERRTSQALIPAGAMSGKVGFVLGCIALCWSSFGIWSFYFFRFVQDLRHISPLESVSQNIPCGISGCIAALTTGYMLSRVRTSYLMAVAMLAFCVGNVLLATMPVEQTYWTQTFFSLIITVWGMDISFPAGTIILSNYVPRQHQGIAASLVATVVNYSISIGLGIAGTVEAHTNQGGQDLLRGYRGAFYAAIGLSGGGFLFALYFIWTESRSLRLQKK